MAVLWLSDAFVRSVKTGDCIGCSGSCASACDKKYEKIVLNLVHAQIPLS